MTKKPHILVTAVGAPPGLNALRALAGSGRYQLTVADADERSTGLYELGFDHFKLPLATQTESYLEVLKREILKRGIDAVIACIEEEIHVLSREQDSLGARTLIPPVTILEKALDKYVSTRIATENGIDCPQSLFIQAHVEIEALREMSLEFSNKCAPPWILKPCTAHGMRKTFRIESIDEFHGAIHHMDEPMILQECIPGKLGSMYLTALLYDRAGKLCQTFASRSVRTLYAGGGPATGGVTLHNQALIDEAIKLLDAHGGWVGPAAIEWMLDPRDQKFKFIEINPRLWGYGSLATGAGINFPEMMAELALGNPVKEQQTYRDGVTMLRTQQDVIFERCPFPLGEENLSHVSD